MKNLEFKPVNSSMIDAIAYDEEAKELYVRFKKGKTFKYTNVPKLVYIEMTTTSSIGTYFTTNVKFAYGYEEVVN